MARPTCDDNHLYGAVLDMRSALEFESPTKAIEIGKKALRPRQDRTLDAIASKHDDLPTRGGGVGAGLTEERIRKRERDRSQLFKLTRPEALLAPANVIPCSYGISQCGVPGELMHGAVRDDQDNALTWHLIHGLEKLEKET